MRRSFLIFLALIGLALSTAGCISSGPHYSDYEYPQRYDADQVQDMADDLEEAAGKLEDEAKESSDHGSEAEEHALEQLDDLEEEAEDFKSKVDDDDDLRDTEDDFRDLMETYQRARSSMRGLYRDEDVYREFDRVSAIMSALGRAYGYRDFGYGR